MNGNLLWGMEGWGVVVGVRGPRLFAPQILKPMSSQTLALQIQTVASCASTSDGGLPIGSSVTGVTPTEAGGQKREKPTM